MGIQGLTSFMDNVFSGWVVENIRGELVIDGNNLCHRLYCLDWGHGGQYPEFREVVMEFFQVLLKADVRPIIVFDGIDYKQEKREVVMKRHRERFHYIHSKLANGKCRASENLGCIIPVFAMEVFQCSVMELNIPVCVSDGEADIKVVEIANAYACPVLSADSDFYLFNIIGGYIPIFRFHWKSTPITAEVYHLKAFLEQFKYQDVSLCYMIPAIIGNDFLDSLYSPSLSQYIVASVSLNSGKCSRLLPVVHYASRFNSLEDFLFHVPMMGFPAGVNRKQLQSNCQTAEKIYNVKATQSVEECMMTTELFTFNGDQIPEWLLQQYRTCSLSLNIMESLVIKKCILRTVVDNSQLPSSLLLSRQLRSYMYRMLGIETVAEIFRHGLDASGDKVFTDPSIGLVLPSLATVPTLSLTEKELLLFSLLACNPKCFEEIENRWKLVIASVVFWTNVTHVPVHIVKSLISCFLLCCTRKNNLQDIRKVCVIPTDYRQSPKWMAALHIFAQWQCVYLDTMTLNQLLMEPLKFLSPAFLYDGKLAMYFTCVTNIDDKISEYGIDCELYHRLLVSILSQSTVAVASNQQVQSCTNESTSKQKPKGRQGCKFEHVNRFALLEDSQSGEDSDIESS